MVAASVLNKKIFDFLAAFSVKTTFQPSPSSFDGSFVMLPASGAATVFKSDNFKLGFSAVLLFLRQYDYKFAISNFINYFRHFGGIARNSEMHLFGKWVGVCTCYALVCRTGERIKRYIYYFKALLLDFRVRAVKVFGSVVEKLRSQNQHLPIDYNARSFVSARQILASRLNTCVN